MSTQPVQDKQTVTPDGQPIAPLIDGVRLRKAVTHADDRGTLTEIFSLPWGFQDDPVVHIYQFTIRPGWVKGWGVHQQRIDRVFLSQGRVKYVMYDSRPESPTYEMLSEIVISDYERTLLVIPTGVYHALQNVGDSEALLISMPTVAYTHADPDIYRLPPNNDLIPYTFDDRKLGW